MKVREHHQILRSEHGEAFERVEESSSAMNTVAYIPVLVNMMPCSPDEQNLYHQSAPPYMVPPQQYSVQPSSLSTFSPGSAPAYWTPSYTGQAVYTPCTSTTFPLMQNIPPANWRKKAISVRDSNQGSKDIKEKIMSEVDGSWNLCLSERQPSPLPTSPQSAPPYVMPPQQYSVQPSGVNTFHPGPTPVCWPPNYSGQARYTPSPSIIFPPLQQPPPAKKEKNRVHVKVFVLNPTQPVERPSSIPASLQLNQVVEHKQVIYNVERAQVIPAPVNMKLDDSPKLEIVPNSAALNALVKPTSLTESCPAKSIPPKSEKIEPLQVPLEAISGLAETDKAPHLDECKLLPLSQSYTDSSTILKTYSFAMKAATPPACEHVSSSTTTPVQAPVETDSLTAALVPASSSTPSANSDSRGGGLGKKTTDEPPHKYMYIPGVPKLQPSTASTSIPERSQSRESDHDSCVAVKPEAVPISNSVLSEDEMEKRSKSIIEEFLHISDYKEAIQCVEELNQATMLYVFVRVGVETTLDSGQSQITRDHMGQLFYQLLQAGSLSKSQFFKGLSGTLKIADDLASDIHYIWLYLAELLVPVLQEGGIPMRELFSELSKPLLPVSKAGIFMSKILHLLCKQMSRRKVGALWRNSGLSWADFLPETEDVHSFITEQKLYFILSDCSSPPDLAAKKTLSPEELNKQHKKHCLKDVTSKERIMDCIKSENSSVSSVTVKDQDLAERSVEENGAQKAEPLKNVPEHSSKNESSDGVLTPGEDPNSNTIQKPKLKNGSSQLMPTSEEKPEGLTPISGVVPDKINQKKLPLQVNPRGIISRCPDFTPVFVDLGGPAERKPPLLNASLRQRPPCRFFTNVFVNEEGKLKKSKNAWKPSKKSATENREIKKTKELFSMVRSILNKLTPQMFTPLMNQMNELPIDTEERLIGVVDLVFKKATDEPCFSVLYGKMCSHLAKLQVPMGDKPTSTVTFQKLLLNRCQKEFGKGKAKDDVVKKKQRELETVTSTSERERLQEELEEAKTTAHRRSIGNIKLIGELFKLQMLAEAIIHDCVVTLLKDNDEESLEWLCILLTSIGKKLDLETTKPRMDLCFKQMEKIVMEMKISSRVCFMLQDVIDLRLHNWVLRRAEIGPTTIEQIHMAAKIEEQEEQRKVHQYMLFNDKTRPVNPREVTLKTMHFPKNSRTDPNKIAKITKLTIDDKMCLGPCLGRAHLNWKKGCMGAGAKARKSDVLRPSRRNFYSPLQASVWASSSTPSVYPDSRGGVRSHGNLGKKRNYKPLTLGPLRSGHPSVVGLGKEATDEPPQKDDHKYMYIPGAPKLQPSTASTSIPERSQSRESDHDSCVAVKPEAVQISNSVLSEDEMEKRSKSIIEEFLHISDYKEAIQCVEELNQATMLYVFVRVGVETTLDSGPSQITRDHMGQLFYQLLQAGSLSKSQFFKGLSEFLKIADDLVIDIPYIWLYLAELLVPVLQEEGIPMNELFSELSKPLLPVAKAGILIAEILHLLCKQMSRRKVGALWRNSGLSWADFLPETEDVHSFITEQKLYFTLSDCSSPPGLASKRTYSAEELNQQLKKHCLKDVTRKEQISYRVQDKLEPAVEATVKMKHWNSVTVKHRAETEKPVEKNRDQKAEPMKNIPEHSSGNESSNVVLTPAEELNSYTIRKPEMKNGSPQLMLACDQRPECLPPISDVVPDKLLNASLMWPPPCKVVPNVSMNDEVNLKKAENAWKHSLKIKNTTDNPEAQKTKEIFRKVRGILNKLMPQMFIPLMNQMNELPIDTEERLIGVVDLVFKRAIHEHSFSVLYGKMCSHLAKLQVPMADKPTSTVTFQKLFLNRCQKEFLKGKSKDDVIEKKQRELEAATSASECEWLQKELDEAKTKAHRRAIGNIKLIGELFKAQMLTKGIIHDCVINLLQNNDEESFERLCILLTTIGKMLDLETDKPRMDLYFNHMEKVVQERQTSSRVCFMLQDLIDLRLHNWVSQHAELGPTTIEQIHMKAMLEEEDDQV